MTRQWNAAPLQWGTGTTTFEVFIEPTCPFSVKAMDKLMPLLDKVGDQRMCLKLRMLSQPWHLWSPVVSRCVIAASTLEQGREKAWKVLRTIATHREAFVFTDHCRGDNRHATPDDIIGRIEDWSQIALADAFAIRDLDSELKGHARYARQNGIHVTPTFMIDGLVQPAMGSGDTVDDWVDALQPHMRHVASRP